MKKKVAVVLLAAVVTVTGLSFSGCDKGSTKEKVDLSGYEFTWATLWDWNNYPDAGESDYGDKRTAWYEQVEKDYNCTIKKVEINAETFFDQVNKAIMAGQKFADFIEVDYSRYQVLKKTGSLMALNTIEGFDPAQEKFFASHRNAYTYEGNAYGVQFEYPQQSSGSFLYYNKTMLENEKCEDPYDLVKSNNWTFAKFQEICKKVTKSLSGGAVDQWGLTTVDWHANNFEKPMIFANGGTMIAKNNEGKYQFSLLSKQAQNALNYLYQLETTDAVLMPSGKDPIAAFYSGEVAFYSGGADNFQSINKNFKEDQEWGIVPLPIGPDADDFIVSDTQLRSWVMLDNNTQDAKNAAVVFDALSEPLYGSVSEDAQAYYDGMLNNTFNGNEQALEMYRLCAEKVVADESWGMSGGDVLGESIYACVRSSEFTPQSAMQTIEGVVNGYIEGFFYTSETEEGVASE